MDLYAIYQKPSLMITLIIILATWVLFWKGIALWTAARKSQKGWFIALLVINSVGLLPIIYLLWFKKRIKEKSEIRIALDQKKPIKVVANKQAKKTNTSIAGKNAKKTLKKVAKKVAKLTKKK